MLVDTAALDEIVDIDETDMSATVEAGCTWDALHRALAPLGLRALAWGTLSGVRASIGGGMSQNGLFWGARGGSIVDGAISFDVVLADGTIVTTGSDFLRPYGPDLTGLFAADCGALGVKARVTLKLVREADAFAYGSFSFAAHEELFAAMSAIAREDLAAESFAFDPFLQAQRMKRDSLSQDAKQFGNMVRAQAKSGGMFKALKEGASVALAGRSFLDGVPFSLHCIAEGRWKPGVEADMERITAIVREQGGKPVENSIPKILRANPFPAPNSMLGPGGERWVPVHGVLPHSKLVEAWDGLHALFANAAEGMARLKVETGALLAATGRTGCLIEPVFFWPGEQNPLHRDALEPGHLAKLPVMSDDPEATALVLDSARTGDRAVQVTGSRALPDRTLLPAEGGARSGRMAHPEGAETRSRSARSHEPRIAGAVGPRVGPHLDIDRRRAMAAASCAAIAAHAPALSQAARHTEPAEEPRLTRPADAPSPYSTIAMQLTARSLERLPDTTAARAAMLEHIAEIEAPIRSASIFVAQYIGHPVKLVVLPEYLFTSYPTRISIPDFAARVGFAADGPEYEALGAVAQRLGMHVAGNAYEQDAAFPGFYFQTSFIVAPTGDVVLRYRRLLSMFAPSPHDVWEAYLDRYGLEGVFPVARTDIGNLAAIASEEILYPEIARALALRGAELFCHSSSEVGSPIASNKDIAKQARAFENLAYVVSANTAGIAGTAMPLSSAEGNSQVVDWKGRVVAQSGDGETFTAFATVDIGALRDARRTPAMTNMLARQRPALFAAAYAAAAEPFQGAGGMMKDGAPAIPDRDYFQRAQAEVIERLQRAGVIG